MSIASKISKTVGSGAEKIKDVSVKAVKAAMKKNTKKLDDEESTILSILNNSPQQFSKIMNLLKETEEKKVEEQQPELTDSVQMSMARNIK
jgi:hypothetical protein